VACGSSRPSACHSVHGMGSTRMPGIPRRISGLREPAPLTLGTVINGHADYLALHQFHPDRQIEEIRRVSADLCRVNGQLAGNAPYLLPCYFWGTSVDTSVRIKISRWTGEGHVLAPTLDSRKWYQPGKIALRGVVGFLAHALSATRTWSKIANNSAQIVKTSPRRIQTAWRTSCLVHFRFHLL
jgi:hypothetical protein